MQLKDLGIQGAEDRAEARAQAERIMEGLSGTVKHQFFDRAVGTGAALVFALLLLLMGSWVVAIVFLIMGVVLYIVQANWCIEFDGSTGWFTFHDAKGQKTEFHVSEIRYIGTKKVTRRPPRRSMQPPTTEEYLTFTAQGQDITVRLRTYTFMPDASYNNGMSDTDKLVQYLMLYKYYWLDPQPEAKNTTVTVREAEDDGFGGMPSI